jgi:hypothetical protein
MTISTVTMPIPRALERALELAEAAVRLDSHCRKLDRQGLFEQTPRVIA